MLKASSLGLHFRTHHGLVRVLNISCSNRCRFSSTLSPAESRHRPVASQSRGEMSDGRSISLTFSYPRSGKSKSKERYKNGRYGPWRRGLVESLVRAGQPFPSTIQTLRRRLLARTGRTQLYHPQNSYVRALYCPLEVAQTDSKAPHPPKPGHGMHWRQSSGSNDLARMAQVVQAWVEGGTMERKGRDATDVAPSLPQSQDRSPRHAGELAEAMLGDEDAERKAQIRGLQKTIRTTSSADEAWDSYQSLLNLELDESGDNSDKPLESEVISSALLTRLSRILSRARPRTRQLFLRYLSLLARIRQVRPNGLIYTWEWNTLINLAGSGFRKTPLDQYNAALDVYRDLRRSSSSSGSPGDGFDSSQGPPARPDIYTYTTLLSIAARTRHSPAVQHATTLLHASGLAPSRITYNALAHYGLNFAGLTAVRDGLQTLVREGHELGTDGVNSFIWAAGKEGQVEAALKVYNVLRRHVDAIQGEEVRESVSPEGPESRKEDDHNTQAEEESTDLSTMTSSSTQEQSRVPTVNPKPSSGRSSNIEGLTLSKDIIPDEITYTTMVQVLAYHGYLIEALRVLTDMLTTPRHLPDGDECFEPTGAIFRALFCAYAKYGRHCRPDVDNKQKLALHAREADWNWERLKVLLDAFFSMPEGSMKPRERDIYWAMIATEKCTGRDPQQCRETWLKLKEKFDFRLAGRMAELDRRYGQPQ